jgi:NADH-quinone oxidoreductase subunit A
MLLQSVPDPPGDWAPVALLSLIALAFSGGTLALSIWVGPKRTGAVKESTYEAGMVPIGDARRRFNVRFYLVAMIFLVFDVEIVFFYPWATLFPQSAAHADPSAGFLLAGMIVFVAILLVAYLYAWAKGVFRWD